MNSLTSFPISVAALQEFLPHRPPMVWISHVLSADESTGVCEVILDPASLPFSSEGLRQSSLIEWMAQGFGYAQASVTDKSSSRAYLAAIKDVAYCDEPTWKKATTAMSKGSKAVVSVKIHKTLPPITLAIGEVRTEDGILLGQGSFKVFVEPQSR